MGWGPITLTANQGGLAVTAGANETPDVTLTLTADQYVRLIAGRLPLDQALRDGHCRSGRGGGGPELPGQVRVGDQPQATDDERADDRHDDRSRHAGHPSRNRD